MTLTNTLRFQDYLRELLKKRLQEYGWEDDMQDFCKGTFVDLLHSISFLDVILVFQN
jgi:hypothetical protein